MPNYAALKAAIAQSQYSGFSDQQIADALNAATTITVDTPIASILDILITAGEWPAVVIRSEVRPPDAGGAVLSALNALALASQVGRGVSIVQTSLANVAARLDGSLQALETAGDISSTSVTAIQALRNLSTTLGAQMGFPVVTVSEIEAARNYQ